MGYFRKKPQVLKLGNRLWQQLKFSWVNAVPVPGSSMHSPLVCVHTLHFNRLIKLDDSETSQLLFALIILPQKPNNAPRIQREVVSIQIWAVTSCHSVSQWFISLTSTLHSWLAVGLQSGDTRTSSATARTKGRTLEWLDFPGTAGAS